MQKTTCFVFKKVRKVGGCKQDESLWRSNPCVYVILYTCIIMRVFILLIISGCFPCMGSLYAEILYIMREFSKEMYIFALSNNEETVV